MKDESLRFLPRMTLISLPVLFCAGSFIHFLYDLCGKLFLAGLLCPINESVWEHLKLPLLPMLLWWGGCYLFLRRRGEAPECGAWAFAALAAIVSSQLTILLLFYTYTGIFGSHALWADILLFFLSLVLGQGLGMLAARRRYSACAALPIFLLALLVSLFVLWTILPPDLPLFVDSNTQRRGIFMI